MKYVLMVLLALGLAMSMANANAEVYRWVDKDGKVHYGDNLPPDAQAEKPKLGDNSVGATEGSFEGKRAAQIAPVTLYVADDCKDACEQARNFLKKRKVPFSERAIKTKEDLEALAKLTGTKEPNAPTLLVGKKAIEGFEAGSWNGALDVVGYPKAL